MKKPFFCLECETSHMNDVYNGDQDHCPACGSTNIVEDDSGQVASDIIEEPDWHHGHFEGDLYVGTSNPNDELE